ncbi:MAG: hypothetical protein ACRCTI_08380 [Beijerinckiaceae bacterium]
MHALLHELLAISALRRTNQSLAVGLDAAFGAFRFEPGALAATWSLTGARRLCEAGRRQEHSTERGNSEKFECSLHSVFSKDRKRPCHPSDRRFNTFNICDATGRVVEAYQFEARESRY